MFESPVRRAVRPRSALRRVGRVRHGDALRTLLFVAALVFMVVLRCTTARADASTAHTVPVMVLAFDSDDAEEHADGLTGALRSRVRASQGWSLIETTQSLGMLTAALRCSGKPLSADCEQRIADQLKVERFIFGYVTRAQSSQVTAEVHLFQKGRQSIVVKETYSDNLKDQNDDTLRKVAQRVLDRLGGAAVGVIVVRVGSDNGEIIVDGDKRVPLQNGVARLELSPGGHAVESAVSGRAPHKRNVLVAAGKETVVDLASAPPPVTEATKGPDKPFPTRKVVGVGLAALGALGLTISAINFASYFHDQKIGKDYQATSFDNPADRKLPPGKTADDVCGTTYQGPLADGTSGTVKFDPDFTICKANANANRHSLIGWISGAVGVALAGAGAYVLLTGDRTEGGDPAKKAGAKRSRFSIVPSASVARDSGSFTLSGTF